MLMAAISAIFINANAINSLQDWHLQKCQTKQSLVVGNELALAP
jgi:hypothetical protein